MLITTLADFYKEASTKLEKSRNYYLIQLLKDIMHKYKINNTF